MNIILILDNIRSVENVGSIFRSADCMGVSEIYLCGTTPTPIDRFGRTRTDMNKVALGAEKAVSWKYFDTTDQAVVVARELGAYACALEQDPRSVNVFEWAPPQEAPTIALVVGYEVSGVAQSILDTCDEILEIPQWGTKESLNVAVATGIALALIRENNPTEAKPL